MSVCKGRKRLFDRFYGYWDGVLVYYPPVDTGTGFVFWVSGFAVDWLVDFDNKVGLSLVVYLVAFCVDNLVVGIIVWSQVNKRF